MVPMETRNFFMIQLNSELQTTGFAMNFDESFVGIFNFCKYYNSVKSAINAGDRFAAGIRPAQKNNSRKFGNFA